GIDSPVHQRVGLLWRRLSRACVTRLLEARVALVVVRGAGAPAIGPAQVGTQREYAKRRFLQAEVAVVVVVLANAARHTERPEVVRHDIDLTVEFIPGAIGDVVMAQGRLLTDLDEEILVQARPGA